jgi:hypothetical protein
MQTKGRAVRGLLVEKFINEKNLSKGTISQPKYQDYQLVRYLRPDWFFEN